MITSRLGANEHSQPTLTITVTGAHDIHGLARHLNESDHVEHRQLGRGALNRLRARLGATAFQALTGQQDQQQAAAS